jgi:hypothetical protein
MGMTHAELDALAAELPFVPEVDGLALMVGLEKKQAYIAARVLDAAPDLIALATVQAQTCDNCQYRRYTSLDGNLCTRFGNAYTCAYLGNRCGAWERRTT